jgi:transposase
VLDIFLVKIEACEEKVTSYWYPLTLQTVISDRDGQALALTDDRNTESLAGYLRTLTDA